jgi:hypothetical protein
MKLKPEHAFQAWADRFIDKAVLPPMFVTGIDIAGTDMANEGRRFTLQARGVKFGVPDMVVCQLVQLSRIIWIELKVDAPVSDTQEQTQDKMRSAGQSVVVCRSMNEILVALRSCGFSMHGNADNLAAEYEARFRAEAPSKVKRAKRSSGPRKPARRKGLTSTALMLGRLV